MKKLFISQPMRGLSDAEILAARQKAQADAEEILNEKVEVLDTFFEDFGHKVNPLYYLGRALTVLAKADGAIFIAGWREARGCRFEHSACEAYGIPVIKD